MIRPFFILGAVLLAAVLAPVAICGMVSVISPSTEVIRLNVWDGHKFVTVADANAKAPALGLASKLDFDFVVSNRARTVMKIESGGDLMISTDKGDVRISGKDGTVHFDKGVTADAAARKFWEAIALAFPGQLKPQKIK